MAETSFIITREELYRRVWEMPLKQLVEEFGTTYHDLSQMARVLGVPRPPRGYWNKLAAGRASDPPPLPDLAPGQQRSCKVRRVYDERRQYIESVDAITASVGRIEVPARLVRPHALVATWVAERRAHERYSVKQNTLAASFFEPSETDGRRHRILQALLPALERQGATITGGRDEAEIEARFGGVVVAFRLREKLRQVRRPLTKEELRRGWSTPNSYHIELHPSGILSFRIETYTKLGWRTWEDDHRAPLEKRLVDIAVTILLVRDYLLKEAREAHERNLLALQEQDRRQGEADRRRSEEARWAAFVSLSRRSDDAAHLRRFLSRLEAAGLPLNDRYGDWTVSEWLVWARERIERTDPLADGAVCAIRSLAQAAS